MHKSFIYLIIGMVCLSGIIFFPNVFIIILPGILLLHLPVAKRTSVVEIGGLIIGLSTASWICFFTLLKFLPLSYSNGFYLVSLVSLVAFIVIAIKTKQITLKYHFGDFLVVLFFLVLTVLFLKIMVQQVAPAGADMATHSYIARVIYEKNGFPYTFEPLVPIKTFGFSPVGMPSLIALISLLSGLTLHTSALLISVLTYPFLGFSLYLLLRAYYSKIASLLTVITVLFIGKDITAYLNWGGNPTILAIAFACFGLAFLVRLKWQEFKSNWSLLILALFSGASFATHQIPLLACGFALSVLWGYFFISHKEHRIIFLKKTFLFILFSLTFLLSFITSMKPLSSETQSYLKEWQQHHEINSVQGDITTALWNVPKFIMERTGYEFLIFVFLGLILSISSKQRHKLWFALGFLVMWVLLINSKYWLLSFSSALYPDRVTATGVIPMAFFVALTYQTIMKKSLFGWRQNKVHFLLILVWLPVVVKVFYGLVSTNYQFILDKSLEQTSVTPDDLKAFNWIEKNTPKDAVFENNYGDAGIWIPAFANRTVHYNDASPHDFDELYSAQKKLTSNYIYIGNKVVYPQHISLDNFSFETDSRYRLIYQSDEAKVYKIVSEH